MFSTSLPIKSPSKSTNCSKFSDFNSENRRKQRWKRNLFDRFYISLLRILLKCVFFCSSMNCFSVRRRRRLWHGFAWNQKNSTKQSKKTKKIGFNRTEMKKYIKENNLNPRQLVFELFSRIWNICWLTEHWASKSTFVHRFCLRSWLLRWRRKISNAGFYSSDSRRDRENDSKEKEKKRRSFVYAH